MSQVYKIGSKGTVVAEINALLGVSGDEYTRETHAKVVFFQTANGLKVDGRVGAQTLPKLRETQTSDGAEKTPSTPVSGQGNRIPDGKLRLSARGIAFLHAKEGYRSKPYLDSAGIPTIGYGNTYYEDGKRVTMRDPAITRERADALFELIRPSYEKPVQQIVAKLTQNQFDALVSFSYNVGVGAFEKSTLRKKVIANPNDPTIRAEFMKWVNAGGKRVQGLVNRRKDEADLYFS